MSVTRSVFATVILLAILAVVIVIITAVAAAVILSIRAARRNRNPIPDPTPAPPLPAESPAGKSLPEKLKEARLSRGMTQEFVAQSLHVSRQAVSKWETGTADPSTANLLALAKLYGVSAADLLP